MASHEAAQCCAALDPLDRPSQRTPGRGPWVPVEELTYFGGSLRRAQLAERPGNPRNPSGTCRAIGPGQTPTRRRETLAETAALRLAPRRLASARLRLRRRLHSHATDSCPVNVAFDRFTARQTRECSAGDDVARGRLGLGRGCQEARRRHWGHCCTL